MQRLLEAIPTIKEWEETNEEERELLFFTLQYLCKRADLPKVDSEYHPTERLALLAARQPYLLDLVAEFDLAIDNNA